RLHASIAEVLQSLYGDNSEAHAVELIYHLAEAASLADPARLVHFCSLAGERALQSYAWEEALSYFQQALAAKEGQPTDAEGAWLQFGLGRAQAATFEGHRLQEAVENFRRSLEYYASVGEVECATTVAEYPLPIFSGQRTGMAQLLAQALSLAPEDSHHAGRLLANYVRVLVIEEGDYEGAQDAYNRALQIARREGDEALEMRILASSTAGDSQYLRLQNTLVKSLRAIELANQADDPRTEVDVRLSAGLSLWWMGDLVGFGQQAQAALPPAERLRDNYWLASALWMNEMAAALRADWQQARELNERCLAVSPRDPRLRCSRALLEAALGDSDQAETHLAPLLESLAQSGSGPTLAHAWAALTLPLVGRIIGSSDHLEVAREAAEAILASPAVIPYFALMARSGLGLLAVLGKDPESARIQYEAITDGQSLRVPGTFMSFVRFVPSSTMTAARLCGLLAQTAGDHDQASIHFEDALSFCRQAGHRPELARCGFDYAVTLLAGDNRRESYAADRQRARTLLEETLDIAQELEMEPLRGRAEELLATLGSSRSSAPLYPDGLT
ncbi:MAG: hypothetical protein ACE5Q6_26850, partial [Dehalococcoidia bacterium]